MWMSRLALVVAVLAAPGFAAEPNLPVFAGAPLDFVPTPLAESSPTELLALQTTQTPWRKLAAPVSTRTEPPARDYRLTIVEPDPRVQSAMPIVTPDPSIDYKLWVITPAEVDGAK